jgi:hypothetical protein
MGKDRVGKHGGRPRGVYALAISANEKARFVFMESCNQGSLI